MDRFELFGHSLTVVRYPVTELINDGNEMSNNDESSLKHITYSSSVIRIFLYTCGIGMYDDDDCKNTRRCDSIEYIRFKSFRLSQDDDDDDLLVWASNIIMHKSVGFNRTLVLLESRKRTIRINQRFPRKTTTTLTFHIYKPIYHDTR